MPPRNVPNRGGPRGRGQGGPPRGGRGGGRGGRGGPAGATPPPPGPPAPQGGQGGPPRSGRGGPFRGGQQGPLPGPPGLPGPQGERGGRGGGRAGRGGNWRNAPRGGAQVAPVTPIQVAPVQISLHQKRPNYGTAGRQITLTVNSFPATIARTEIIQYDVVQPETLPARFKLELFSVMQDAHPTIFTPRAVYDGQKIAFASQRLPLTVHPESQAATFEISDSNSGRPGRPPKVFKIILKEVAVIDTQTLHDFVGATEPHNNEVFSTIMAHNVAVRMTPNLTHPFRGRAFFTTNERCPIPGGLELWRGIFQSVRPGINRIVLNVDLKVGVFIRGGLLIDVCMDFMQSIMRGAVHPTFSLTPQGLNGPQRNDLRRFLSNIKVKVRTTGARLRTIRGLGTKSADQEMFTKGDGTRLSVADHFNSATTNRLQYPGAVCVQIGRDALVPIEACEVPPGQFANKNLSPPQLKELQGFASIKPMERLAKIQNGLTSLQHGQSEYVRQFGIAIDAKAIEVKARIILPPQLKYRINGVDEKVNPKFGAWQMMGKHFNKPATIDRWALICYESQRFFNPADCDNTIREFVKACRDVGITVNNAQPHIKHANAHQSIRAHFIEVQQALVAAGGPPTLLVFVLPMNGADIRNQIKHLGDIEMGIPTQCLLSNKCKKASGSYWNNVMHKVNLRLGGINGVATSPIVDRFLIDRANPSIIMGADVMHPPPGPDDKPSFTAVVGALDSNATNYTTSMSVQMGRQRHENIADMKRMAKEVLERCLAYRRDEEGAETLPNRLIFYRDGVSEGEFGETLQTEVAWIREACEELSFSPKITFIVVGKKHHVQMFSKVPNDIDNRSGNLLPGTVIDTDIAHPTDFDFYLQSHAGILGTSRPGHYSVIHDENNFNADSVQALSYALCHTYGRCTRSVSIPAPVYYADIVCSRAKFHYSPDAQANFSDTASSISGSATGQQRAFDFTADFRRTHTNQLQKMYFV